jgi:hypothetical protein
MTTYAQSFHPPWAVTAWVDDRFVYVELPCKDGPPYITKHELSDGGLSRALRTMMDAHKALSPTSDFKPGPEAKIKRSVPQTKSSPEQRERARALLRKVTG